MREDDAKVVVKLDTRGARRELDQFIEHGKEASKKTNKYVKKGIGTALSIAGLSGATGVMIGSLGRSSQSSTGALFGETFGAWGEQFSRWVYGTKGIEAKAASQARQDIMNSAAYQVGMTGEIAPQIREQFNALKAIYEKREEGKSVIAADPDFYGPGFGAVIKRFVDAFIDAVDKWFNGILSRYGG